MKEIPMRDFDFIVSPCEVVNTWNCSWLAASMNIKRQTGIISRSQCRWIENTLRSCIDSEYGSIQPNRRSIYWLCPYLKNMKAAYKFASQKNAWTKPSRMRYIIYRQEKYLVLMIGSLIEYCLPWSNVRKHGGHITDVDGNIKAFPDY